MGISGLNNVSAVDVGKRAIKDFMDDDMSTYAGALTYRILLAIFPFLIFLLTVLGALGLESFFDWLLDQAQQAFPAELFTQFETIVDQVRAGAGGGLLSFGLIGAIWAAAGGVRAAMNALNTAYDVEESRPIWKLYPMSIAFTIGLAAILIAAVGLMIFGPQSMEWLAGQVGLGDIFVTVWAWLRIPVAILLMVLAIALIYYIFPNVDQPFQIVSPGAILAVLTWVLASIGFSFYITNFANYNATYGALGGVIVLLLYFYISSMVLLLGAEVNGVIYKSKKDSGHDDVEDGAAQESTAA